MVPEHISVYSDGSCYPNPGPGGWAAIIHRDVEEIILQGNEYDSTNNRMEMMGPIAALEHFKEHAVITIYTDSQYVAKGWGWLKKWEKRHWKNSSGDPVKNIDLWQRMKTAGEIHSVIFSWMPGHVGHVYNERADQLALQARLQLHDVIPDTAYTKLTPDQKPNLNTLQTMLKKLSDS